MQIQRPSPSEYASFYAGYVSRVPEGDLLGILESQIGRVQTAFGSVPRDKEQFRYATDKWSIRELLSHVIDAERVMGFRAFCFSRGDENTLPSFSENDYVRNVSLEEVPLTKLIEEYELVRRGHVAFMTKLTADAWVRSGIANGNAVTVRALAYILAGHLEHHLGVLESKYLT